MNNLLVCVSISWVGSQKVIHVHSPIKFINKTNINLALMDYFIVGAHSYKYCPMLQFQHSEVFSIMPTVLPSEEQSLLNETVTSEILPEGSPVLI